jgi:hypothetical protein
VAEGQDNRRRVIGLCAQWCGVCREWRAAFEAAAAAHPGDAFEWVDVEDEAERVGDVDIETFPTLLVGQAGRVLFFGTVLPTPQLITRLLASLDPDGDPRAAPEAGDLLRRLTLAH